MLPQEITILGETFKINRPTEIFVDGEHAVGAFDYQTRVIEVLSTLPDHEAISTLLHEALHCWLDISSINNLLGLDETREEGLVLALERQFMPTVASILGSSLLSPPKPPKKRAAKAKAPRGRK